MKERGKEKKESWLKFCCRGRAPSNVSAAMHARVLILAACAAAMSPLAAAFAPTLPTSAGRVSPGRMALRMNRDIFSGSQKPVMMPEPAPKEPGPPRPNIPMPMVAVGESQMDIYSRLAKDRILLLGTDVNDEVANNLVAQMLFLANEDPGKDITMYSECPDPRRPSPLSCASPVAFARLGPRSKAPASATGCRRRCGGGMSHNFGFSAGDWSGGANAWCCGPGAGPGVRVSCPVHVRAERLSRRACAPG